jgi:hypothetical protein
VEWEAAERAAKSAADELAKAERAAAEKVRDEARRAERLARGASGDKDGGEDQEDDGAALKTRGYNTLADGRKTSYFMHVPDSQTNQLLEAAGDGGRDSAGSAWNAAGTTWDDKETSQWCEAALRRPPRAAHHRHAPLPSGSSRSSPPPRTARWRGPRPPTVTGSLGSSFEEHRARYAR